MKWIKHMAATRRDERIARLIGDGGQAGMARYGYFWAVQEIIAEQMDGADPNCSVCYPISVWAHLLVTRPSLVESTLSTLGVTGVVTVERQGSDIRVTNRNLLKYRDEYSKKSGHKKDNAPARTEGEGDIDKEEEKKQILLLAEQQRANEQAEAEDQEAKIYEAYPRKVGRPAALRAIRSAVGKLVKGNLRQPAMTPYEARKFLCRKAMQYAASPAGQKTPPNGEDFRPHPATWFNQERYLDEPTEWQKSNGGNYGKRASKGEQAIANLAAALGGGPDQASPHDDGDPTGHSAFNGILEGNGKPVIEGELVARTRCDRDPWED